MAFGIMDLACAGAKFTRTGKVFPDRGENCSISVYMTPPKGEYEEICIIEAKTSASAFSSKDLSAMMPDIKEQGCKCGADAVVVNSSNRGNWLTSQGGYSSSVGIKFKNK